ALSLGIRGRPVDLGLIALVELDLFVLVPGLVLAVGIARVLDGSGAARDGEQGYEDQNARRSHGCPSHGGGKHIPVCVLSDRCMQDVLVPQPGTPSRRSHIFAQMAVVELLGFTHRYPAAHIDEPVQASPWTPAPLGRHVPRSAT